MASLTDRMLGAAKLDIQIYEEVEADESATVQAAIVVGIVSVASGIGSAQAGAAGMFGGLVAAFLGWLIWSGVTYLIGDKLLGGTASWGELLRTLGFAQSPGVLYLLGILPVWAARSAFWSPSGCSSRGSSRSARRSTSLPARPSPPPCSAGSPCC